MHKAPDVYKEKRINMLTAELRGQVFSYLIRHQFRKSGTTTTNGKARPDVFPHVSVQRHRVFTSTPETGTYNHQAGICRWRDRYWYVFSNSAVDEEVPGMRTMITSSPDLETWSEPVCVAAGDVPGDMWRQTAGVMGTADRLVVFVQTKTGHHLTRKPGMSATDITRTVFQVDLFTSADGATWEERPVADNAWWFEAPRLTQEGRLLCAGTLGDGQPIVYLWPGANPLAAAELIAIPHDRSRGLDSGHFPYGEASWYQTDDGTILMFHRNETDELRLRLAVSRDGGRTWSEPMLSNIPDSMSRVSAGRLPDGRFYLVNNAIADLLNRVPLMIWLSADGFCFDEQRILIDEPTTISFPGALKAHGHQYPCTLVEDERLIVCYSVNKEHMELLTVALSEL